MLQANGRHFSAGHDPMMTRLIKRGISSTLDTMGLTASLEHSLAILDHMRATNKDISDRQANERETTSS